MTVASFQWGFENILSLFFSPSPETPVSLNFFGFLPTILASYRSNRSINQISCLWKEDRTFLNRTLSHMSKKRGEQSQLLAPGKRSCPDFLFVPITKSFKIGLCSVY